MLKKKNILNHLNYCMQLIRQSDGPWTLGSAFYGFLQTTIWLGWHEILKKYEPYGIYPENL